MNVKIENIFLYIIKSVHTFLNETHNDRLFRYLYIFFFQFHAVSRYQSKEMKILYISFSRVGIEPANCRAYCESTRDICRFVCILYATGYDCLKICT